MNPNFNTLKDLIEKSDLPNEDKTSLINFYSAAKDEDLEDTIFLIVENPSWVRVLSENFKSKEDAIISKDTSKWQGIVRDEESQLKSLQELTI